MTQKKKPLASPDSRQAPEDQDYLAGYSPDAFPRPSVTVDLVILTVLDRDLKALLVRRREPPFQGFWALPGGFVRAGGGHPDEGEDLDEAAARVLGEETTLSPGLVYLEQLYTFGRRDRDPRTRVISVAYYALVRPDLVPIARAGERVTQTRWQSFQELDGISLAFDHREILETALRRIRGKLDYTPIAFQLVTDPFTIPELRSVYEVVLGTPQDPGNFRRRFLSMVADGLIEEAPGRRPSGTKPARVYRFRREEPAGGAAPDP